MMPLENDKAPLVLAPILYQVRAIMAHIDTHYRISAKAPLPEAFLNRIQRIRRLSRQAKTHAQKIQLGEQLGEILGSQTGVNVSQASVSEPANHELI